MNNLGVTQEQIDKCKERIMGEIALHLYTAYATKEEADVLFSTMPVVLRELADTFQEVLEEVEID